MSNELFDELFEKLSVIEENKKPANIVVNYHCSCKKKMSLTKDQDICCVYCGSRVLFKDRTKNYIIYKTE